MKKNIKVAAALTLCGAVLAGAIYYTNGIYLPQLKKAQAQAADSELQAAQSSESYNYTVNTSLAASSARDSAASSSDDTVQVTTESNGDVTINRTWDAKPGTLDTSTSSPDETATANIGGGGDKITGEDGTYQGETPTTTTSKPTTSSTPKTSSSSNTGTKSSSSTNTGSTAPQNGDTRTENGQKQIYIDGFGWVMDASGGSSDSIEMPDELSGIQVGEMG